MEKILYNYKPRNITFQAKYESMQANIRNMEDAQRIAELETEVSEYKIKVSNLINTLICSPI